MKLQIILVLLGLCAFPCMAVAKDRALLVGIDQYRDPAIPQLKGCADDAMRMKAFLKNRYGFQEADFLVLTNDNATSEAILSSFSTWLVAQTSPGDRVFFFYSGHGSYLKDDNGDETNDREDETIAPFNTILKTGANEIRDDEFERFISQLSGRRTVMVFDSCHSGTISRGVKTLAKFIPPPDAVSLTNGNIEQAQETSFRSRSQAQTKDLEYEPFVNPPNIERVAGTVVISAAQANQTANQVYLENCFQGLLAYLFMRAQQNETPALTTLKTRIEQGMKDMEKSGVVKSPQNPVFEVIGPLQLEGQPLFGTWTQAVQVAVVNPPSNIKLSLTTTSHKTIFTPNDKLAYEIQTDTAGYVYLLVFSEDAPGVEPAYNCRGEKMDRRHVSCLFPNQFSLDNYLTVGTHIIPKEEIVLTGTSTDVVVVILSRTKLNIATEPYRDKCGNHEYSWEDMFRRLGLARIQEMVSTAVSRGGQKIGAMKVPSDLDWQAASIVIETRK